MHKNRLGRSGIVVSDICMGTMTFGSSADEPTSIAIMDKAFEAGIDFFDTAEMYPVPPDAKWIGATEAIVGRWMKARGNRDGIILATKVAGPSHGWISPPIRSGKTGLDRHQIVTAVEASLERLQTDYIDLYQTHWPDPELAKEETMRALDDLVEAGMSLVTMATAWSKQHDFVASTIVGATRPEQLDDILAAADVTLDADTLKAIDAVSKAIRYPMG